MIQLGLRLAVSGGREAFTRLVTLTLAVGIGVGLLLAAVAATNAVSTWNARHAWFYTGTALASGAGADAAGGETGTAPLWWHPSNDIFDGQAIERFDVAATGASSPVPPGLSRDPAPGQYYASPALAELLRATPASQLADRYPGHLAGTIGDAALPSPGSLVIVIGRTPAQLAHTSGTAAVTSITTVSPSALLGPGNGPGTSTGLTFQPSDQGVGASAVDLILAVVALAILAPILIFIGTATRLSAARREQRFAAMRLVGATRRQLSLLAATESAGAAIAGVAIGFGIFFLLRVPVAGISFIGQPFFPAELTLSLADILVIAIGVPAAAIVAARIALRRVHISPLGVTRRETPQPPRAWRVIPLAAGLAELGFWAVHGHPAGIGGQILAFASSFALIIAGLVLAGPWITMVAAAGLARWTSRPGTLLAARRIADDPRAAFRAVSGLVLALFITTVAVVAITTQNAKNETRFGSIAAAGVVTDQLAVSPQANGSGGQSTVVVRGTPEPAASAGTPGPAASGVSAASRLRGISGVESAVIVRAVPGLTIPGSSSGTGPAGQGGPDGQGGAPAGVVSCAQLASVSAALGHCPAGAATAEFPSDLATVFDENFGGITWPAARVPAVRLDTLGVDSVNVATNGSVTAIEQVRTALETLRATPAVGPPSTINDLVAKDNSTDGAYQQLANV